MPADPNENQLFRWADDMPPQLWDDLAARPPAEAAQATGAVWDGQGYTIDMLGREHRLEPKTRRVFLTADPEHRLSYQTGLVLISTLIRSLGVPPAGRMVTPQELPGGTQFFHGPHAINNRPLAERFGHDPAALLESALALGGEAFEAGDQGVRLPGLPMIPLYALIWEGDDEFSPRAVVGMDANAHYHLALDGIWALSNLMVFRLLKEGPV
ncbi:MAG: DUF3786 domain-containing protein [Desulfarculus sp.]|nr:DUF3786 domain-containing protein [Pseudomonadota bacterium]MBU4600184.1 DUF3786 domain-containing protein [Pseudomonadota bacterium]MBV1718066.1 DUF3786 domain-containing protein [Desulfarculus sp.]MBV1738897.1 DUF3786 domain-containing protein [Desulfarculus sp.]MBV1750279.1 DUF3786 domain-containing protein [Desulfarculus sp.]